MCLRGYVYVNVGKMCMHSFINLLKQDEAVLSFAVILQTLNLHSNASKMSSLEICKAEMNSAWKQCTKRKIKI